MALQCPKCQSDCIDTKNYAMRTVSIIGTLAGAIGGAAGFISGAEIGVTVGIIGGPFGMGVGSIAGAIIGGLIAGAAGGTTGARLGEVIDDNVLDNYYCLDCMYSFSKKTVSLNEVESSYSERHPNAEEGHLYNAYRNFNHPQEG